MAIDLKLFEHVKASGETGIGARELATKVGADEALICKYDWLAWRLWDSAALSSQLREISRP